MDRDAVVKKVLNLLVSVNQFELGNAELIGVFVKAQGFILSYKIYHDNDGILYEGQVTYDRLRRRSYIISFGKMGFWLSS